MSKATRVNTKISKPVRKKRPPVTGTLVGVRLQPDDLALLEAWRDQQDDQPSLPEAMRRIMLRFLKKSK